MPYDKLFGAPRLIASISYSQEMRSVAETPSFAPVTAGPRASGGVDSPLHPPLGSALAVGLRVNPLSYLVTRSGKGLKPNFRWQI